MNIIDLPKMQKVEFTKQEWDLIIETGVSYLLGRPVKVNSVATADAVGLWKEVQIMDSTQILPATSPTISTYDTITIDGPPPADWGKPKPTEPQAKG